MANFGIPYMGSKDKIARSIALNFPKSKHFYDLFGGGFSMTHYMIENRENCYEYFHYNEIQKSIVDLVKRSINGEYSYERFKPPWVSREDFFRLKDKDAYVRVCWSFGNNQKNFMFSTQIEPYKKSMHMAVVFDSFDDLAKNTLGFSSWPKNVNTIYKKRLYLRQKIEWYRAKNRLPKCLYKYLNIKQLERLQQLEQLERLQQLEQLQCLQRLQRLNMTALDYRDVEIQDNSVVYCDIPYRGTRGYLNKFNHKEFYDWAASRKFPVYISEYSLPDDRFKQVYEVDKIALLDAQDKTKTKQEKLFWNGVQ